MKQWSRSILIALGLALFFSDVGSSFAVGLSSLRPEPRHKASATAESDVRFNKSVYCTQCKKTFTVTETVTGTGSGEGKSIRPSFLDGKIEAKKEAERLAATSAHDSAKENLMRSLKEKHDAATVDAPHEVTFSNGKNPAQVLEVDARITKVLVDGVDVTKKKTTTEGNVR